MSHSGAPVIRTVRGDIDPSTAGVALCHEHLAVDLSAAFDDPDLCLDNPQEVADDLSEARALGLGTVVDVSASGMGRDPMALGKIADLTGLNVVASAGYYFERFFPDHVFEVTEADLAERITREIDEGIDGTEVRAGAIGEIGNSGGEITALEQKALRAVGRSQRQTGACVITHTDVGRFGGNQLDLLEAGGADPTRVLIGHMDCTADTDAHLAVVKRGAYIGFDRVSLVQGVYGLYQTDETRVSSILRLLEGGYAGQIILSHDLARKSRLRHRGGGGYSHIMREFLPMLRRAGVDEATLRAILVDNPARLLAFSPKG